MQIRSTKVFYFEKYFENTILFRIFKILLSEHFILYFKILFRSILHITDHFTHKFKHKSETISATKFASDSVISAVLKEPGLTPESFH